MTPFRKCLLTAAVLTPLLMGCGAAAAGAAEHYGTWPLLQPLFPSTGGAGIMIGEYDPVIYGDRCVTAFTAIEPNGTVHRNSVAFEAVPAQGGILCTNGRWRSADGLAAGTTPSRVFLRNGGTRGSPP